MPLSSAGLCEAEITTPAAHVLSRSSCETAGVGRTPPQVTTPPDAWKLAASHPARVSVEARVSPASRIERLAAGWREVRSARATPRRRDGVLVEGPLESASPDAVGAEESWRHGPATSLRSRNRGRRVATGTTSTMTTMGTTVSERSRGSGSRGRTVASTGPVAPSTEIGVVSTFSSSRTRLSGPWTFTWSGDDPDFADHESRARARPPPSGYQARCCR